MFFNVFPCFLSSLIKSHVFHGLLRSIHQLLLTGISSPSCPTIVPPTFQVLRSVEVEGLKHRNTQIMPTKNWQAKSRRQDPLQFKLCRLLVLAKGHHGYMPCDAFPKKASIQTSLLYPSSNVLHVLISIFAKSHEKHPAQGY